MSGYPYTPQSIETVNAVSIVHNVPAQIAKEFCEEYLKFNSVGWTGLYNLITSGELLDQFKAWETQRADAMLIYCDKCAAYHRKTTHSTHDAPAELVLPPLRLQSRRHQSR